MPTCPCRCHRGSVIVTPWPDVRDVLEAAVACPACLDRHCPAITANWPWPYIPRPDPPPPPLGSADGYPFSGDGPE